MNITDSLALLDREQGGSENINDHGIRFHRFLKFIKLLSLSLLRHFFNYSLIKATDLLQFLYKKGKISKEIKMETSEFLHKHTYQTSHANIS